mmetsp:Transcript_19081/g.30337  ORF Transcript_19081/g.30337 Transcript_19081/m.30337 type:complete len:322 (+) Transcript_19081:100-1065(+)
MIIDYIPQCVRPINCVRDSWEMQGNLILGGYGCWNFAIMAAILVLFLFFFSLPIVRPSVRIDFCSLLSFSVPEGLNLGEPVKGRGGGGLDKPWGEVVGIEGGAEVLASFLGRVIVGVREGGLEDGRAGGRDVGTLRRVVVAVACLFRRGGVGTDAWELTGVETALLFTGDFPGGTGGGRRDFLKSGSSPLLRGAPVFLGGRLGGREGGGLTGAGVEFTRLGGSGTGTALGERIGTGGGNSAGPLLFGVISLIEPTAEDDGLLIASEVLRAVACIDDVEAGGRAWARGMSSGFTRPLLISSSMSLSIHSVHALSFFFEEALR